MENITLTVVNTVVLTAVILFVIAVVQRKVVSAKDFSPPALPVGKVPVWFYHRLDIIGLVVIGGIFYVLSLGNMLTLDTDEPVKASMEGMIFSIGFQFFMAGLCGVIVLGRANIREWLGVVWENWPLVFLIAPFTVVGMWGLFVGLYGIGYMDLMDKLGVEQVQETVKMFQEEKNLMIVGLMAFAAALVAPVCEEVVFRGYLYPVAKKFSGPWVAGICTALLFSAVHGSMAALLPLFIFGVVLALLYEATGSIWAPISVHFLFNAATVSIQLGARFYGIDSVAGQ
ncbi:lysostaphin resistance A-like protein [Luteolibacter sp. AS25]|uniref:CPBP family intramembrane glutamic endopeptidase n=1 Tax=Luteolibacter sp. AS25 TaxID=3135776 RepID=UPI00398B38D1